MAKNTLFFLGCLGIFFLWTGCQSGPVKKIPSSEEIHTKADQARDALMKGNLDQAKKLADQTLALNPWEEKALKVKALSLVFSNQREESHQTLQKLLKGDYKNPHHWMDLAIVSWALGRDKEGFQNAYNVLELTSVPLKFDPKFSFCYYFPFFYNLGILGALLTLPQPGEFFLRKSLEMEPQNIQIKMALLRLYLETKKVDRVLALLKELQKEEGKYPKGPSSLDLVLMAHDYYFQKKEYEKAAQTILEGLEFLKIQKKKYPFSLLLALGYTLFQRKGLERETISVLEEALKQNPTHTQSLLLLGIAYLREGLPSSYANAYSVFKRLILHKGDQPEYYFFLGLTCQKTGRLQEAYEAYQKALGIRQDFLEAQINFHGLASNYPSWKGLIDFEKNLADHPVMLANLAVLYQRMGYPKVADSLFSKAINLASNQDVRTMISELSKEAKNGK